MKSKLILMLLLGILSLFTAKAGTGKSTGSITLGSDDPRDASKGENPGHTSRSLPVIPVLCTLEDGIVCVDFLNASGDLTITTSDAVAPVYIEQVNVTVPMRVSVPVAGYAPGEYVIHLNDGAGNGLYGIFVLC